MNYWQVKRDGEVISHGPAETFPTSYERKALRDGGHRIYADGKLYKEAAGAKNGKSAGGRSEEVYI